MSDSSRPDGLQPTRLLRPWDFPGKSTGNFPYAFLLFQLLILGCHGRFLFIQPSFLHPFPPGIPQHSPPTSPCSLFLPWQSDPLFSSVTQLCPTLCDPMNRSTPGLPVQHQLPEFTQTHIHRVSDVIQPSHPLSSPSPPAPNPSQHQSLFQ